MNPRDHAAILFGAMLASLAAVALIIYQHRMATNQVLAAVGSTATLPASGSQASDFSADPYAGLGSPLSLAGSPIVGQDGTSATPAVNPLNVQPGYTLQ